MPSRDARLQLRGPEALSRMDEEDINIFTRTQVQKYQDRGANVADLNMKDYFRFYKLTKTSTERETDDNIYDGIFDPRGQVNLNFDTIKTTDDGRTIPMYTKDRQNYIFTAREKIPLIRYFETSIQQSGDAFYYKQIVLHHPCRNFETDRADRVWRDYFHDLLATDDFRQNFTPEFLENLNQQEIALDQQFRQTVEIEDEELLDDLLARATDEQRSIFTSIIANPWGIYLVHGGGGVGKSHLLRMIYMALKQSNFVPVKLAPTGVAAVTIGGQTIHRFLGITNRPNIANPRRVDDYFKDLEPHQKLALLIDEVSMVNYDILTELDTVLRHTNLTDTINGKVLTIFFGDFGQLTPVPIHNRENKLPFDHPIFDFVSYFPMTTLVRASPDENIFKQFLTNLRLCNFNQDVFDVLRQRSIEVPENVLRVYCSNEAADRFNQRSLENKQGATYYYHAVDNSNASDNRATFRETGLLQTLLLKQGVPVMLINNVSVQDKWSNGTMAFVHELHRNHVVIRKITGETLTVKPITRFVYRSAVSRTQIPLSLAFASTIHKVQSLTIDNIAVCLQDDFLTHGQLYVACSRVRRLENLFFFPNLPLARISIKSDLPCLQAIESIEGSLLD